MIEVYLFLAAFAIQILAISVLLPARFSRVIRAEQGNIPAERLAELYPGVDVAKAYERFLARYRAANGVVAVLGVLLLGWFFRYMQRTDWNEGAVSGAITTYFVLQNLPLMLIAWFVKRFNRMYRLSTPERIRKAVLQRRGLFDFVSPVAVALAVVAYIQFAAFMFYVARHPFRGFAGPYVNIGLVTLMYGLLASVVYWMMYGRKRGPLDTHESRARVTRFVVRGYTWCCILVPIFLSLSFARRLLELQTWSPLGRSLSLLILALCMLQFRRPADQPHRLEA